MPDNAEAKTPNAEAKTPMEGNQQVPQRAGNPRFRNPGLDPSPDPKIVVKAINPPVTPDQVVGMAEMPSAATLDLPKIQNIKIPPVKNKTIQGHLKAIEAKMTATEKLMKDVVKLQKLQIITEKELFERKRELYQNTFEEYLLDKTVDFENPDDDDGIANAIKKGPGGGFPFFGGRRRRKGRGPKGGSGAGAGAAAAGAAAEAAADTKQDEEAPVVATTPVTPKQQPNLSQEQVEELLEKLTERRKELDPNYDPMEQEAPIPTITRPGDPVTAPEKFVPDPVDVPKPKTTPADIQRTIEVLQYAQKNGVPSPTIRRKDGFIVTLPEDGRVRVYEPGHFDVTGLNAVLLKSLQFTQAFMDAVPTGAFRGRRLTGTPPRVFRPRQPDKRPSAPVVKPTTNTVPSADNVVPLFPNKVVPGPNNPRALPPGQRGGDLVPAAQAQSDIVPFQRQQQQQQQTSARKKGGPLDTAGPTVSVDAITTERITKSVVGTDVINTGTTGKTASKSTIKKGIPSQGELVKLRNDAEARGERNAAREYQKLLEDYYMEPNIIKDQASGGIGDIDLYSSKSLNYFRGMSSKIMPMADGGFMGWFNKGVNTRIPVESKAKFGNPFSYFQKNPDPTTLFGDDALQRGQSNKNFKAGKKPGLFGRPDRAFGLDLIDSFKQRRLVTVPASQGGPMSGPTPITRELVKRPVRAMRSNIQHPVMLALDFIINDLLLNPRSTAVYDQVTGPNAYYNDPAYKGPMPSQNLENAQSSMMSGNDPKVEVKPLPPEYIKIPGKKKAPDFVGTESPDIQMRSSIFSRSSTHID